MGKNDCAIADSRAFMPSDCDLQPSQNCLVRGKTVRRSSYEECSLLADDTGWNEKALVHGMPLLSRTDQKATGVWLAAARYGAPG